MRLITLATIVFAASSAGSCSGDIVAAESGFADEERVSTTATELIAGPKLAIDWNRIARQMQPNANVIVPHSRMFAIIHIGLHDAMNAVLGRYETWAPPVAVSPLPNIFQRRHAATAAAAQAAYELATLLVPQTNRAPTTTFDPSGQPILPFGRDYLQQLIDAQHAEHMSKIPAGIGKTKGINVGHQTALQIWRLRSSDNAIPANLPPGQTAPSAFFGDAPKSDTFLQNWWNPYMGQLQTPPIGVWRQHPVDSGTPCFAGNYPTPFPSFNWWDTVTPFGIDNVNDFIAAAPPAPNQEAPTLDLSPDCSVDPLNKFACQMEATRVLGAHNSTERTADQTSSARWWGNVQRHLRLQPVRRGALAAPHPGYARSGPCLRPRIHGDRRRVRGAKGEQEPVELLAPDHRDSAARSA